MGRAQETRTRVMRASKMAPRSKCSKRHLRGSAGPIHMALAVQKPHIDCARQAHYTIGECFHCGPSMTARLEKYKDGGGGREKERDAAERS